MQMIQSVSIDEVLAFIEMRKLYSRGIGLTDVQLMGSVVVAVDAVIWTRDKRLNEVASELGIAYSK